MLKKEPYIGMPIILGDYDATPKEQATVAIEDRSKKENSGSNDQLVNFPIAMAYTPIQKWNSTYEVEKGFMAGTIFPELNLPFKGYQGGMSR